MISFLALMLLAEAGARSSPLGAVVKQLQDMSEKSKADAKEEAELFNKFKCFCDSTLSNTTKQIATLTDEISTLKARISALTALDSELSYKQTTLNSDLATNVAALQQMTAVRQKAAAEFQTHEADLVSSLKQLDDAFTKLGLNPANVALLEVSNVVEKARAFLARQTPGTANSGVAGVLKSTRDTYAQNLEEMRQKETAKVQAFTKLNSTKASEYDNLQVMLSQVQSGIADTNQELGAKREELVAAQDNLQKTQTFQADTKKLCEEKTKVNEQRKVLRSQEDAALSQAIAVLNSDEAFQLANNLGFVQLSSIRKHADTERRPDVLNLLRTAAHSSHSARLAGLAALVSTGNPFEKVISEIDNMQTRITKEGQQDKKKFDWCAVEVAGNSKGQAEKDSQVTSLTASIDQLQKSIDEMSTNLATQKTELSENQVQQKQQTDLRKSETAEYEKNVADLVSTEKLIGQGMQVLKKFYDSVAPKSGSFIQIKEHRQLQAPDTKDGPYSGQSDAGKTVIGLLEDIKAKTKEEEDAAHKAEKDAQVSYENSLKALVAEEKSLTDGISKNNGEIAQAKLDSDSKKSELSATNKEKQSLSDYLASIKSGCDFISANFDAREASRAAESKALKDASNLIKATPAFKKK